MTEGKTKVQQIWDDQMEEIPDEVLEEMVKTGRHWRLLEKPDFSGVRPDSSYRYYSQVCQMADYMAVDTGDGRHFTIWGTLPGQVEYWEQVGHIVK